MHKLIRGFVRRWTALGIVAALAVASSVQAGEPASKKASDEDAIRSAIESYVAAYNRGDAKAVAEHWSDTGEWRSPSGERFQGKEAIEKGLRALFAENKGVRIEVIDPSVRIAASDAAIEEGTVRVFRPSEAPRDFTYIAVHVKKGGQWKLDSVRETEVPEALPASSALQELAWLAGQWVDTSPDASGEVNVAWTKNKSFLTYQFKASAPEMDDLEGVQVIGWDPAAETIRSWMFDSDGGFGEGVWSKKDDGWVVKFHQVLPDGRKASATNIYTRIDDNTFTWKSIGRKVGDEFLPNVEAVRMVRKMPAAPAKEAAVEAKKSRKPASKE